MDTSPEYIKMCEKAEEIQKDHEPHRWDLYYCDMNDLVYDYGTGFGPDGSDMHSCDIWLPRQDQLQDMLTWDRAYYPLSVLQDYVRTMLQKRDYYKQFLSMEQLWLALVMEEKFNKTWNGEEWVKA
ncbi:MAG: hypothetical protein A4E63_01202 [Syntrophorhabdus sp. PtaU1.Bin050]|nr:MAG: hypothetical protein A4E63_01202 [Syntrophorhabdus sp. PtaU1.Bin050]